MPYQSTSQIDESHAPDTPEAVNRPVLRQRLPIAQGVPLHPSTASYLTLHERSNRVKTKAEIIRANTEAKAHELQLEVRVGIFEL